MVPVTVAPLCAKNKKRGAKMGCTKIVFVITLVQIAAKQSSKHYCSTTVSQRKAIQLISSFEEGKNNLTMVYELSEIQHCALNFRFF